MHPLIDYLFIGGGLTIPIFLAVYFIQPATPVSPIYLFLLINGAHFAASTVRLYTKPGATREQPFLSWGFPLVCLLAVAAGLNWPSIGRQLTALYFTWSPYHYAAQSYGLAVLYAMRSGARLDDDDKRQMWLVCLLPFVYALLTSTTGGLAWFISRDQLAALPALASIHSGLVILVSIGVVALPFSLFVQLHQSRRKNVPLISLLLQVTNGIWWLAAGYENAFWWAAAAHSVQYLLIAALDYARAQMKKDNPRLGTLHTPAFHAAWFYGLSFVVAAVLFFAIPVAAFVPLGFDAASSIVMMTVIINHHHFIVDGFVWKSDRAAPRPAPTLDQPAHV